MPNAYPTAHTVADVERNLATVRARIDRAARRVGRDPDQVRLLPVGEVVHLLEIRLKNAAG